MATTMSFRHHISDQHYTSLNMDQGSLQLVPDFVFPPRPIGEQSTSSTSKRSVSMNVAHNAHHTRSRSKRQSVSALPTFTFNSSDTSGRLDQQPSSPVALTSPISPSKSVGHRRGASELGGGDGRMSIGGMLGPSPSLSLPPSFPAETTGSPSRRRGHAHRRSVAVSSHDLASIFQPRDVNIGPQASLSQTPAESVLPSYPSPSRLVPEQPTSGDEFKTESPLTSPTSDEYGTRPISRPRVGFSERIEFIPRPLSIVSADTASSISTVRGHSVSNSMSSIIGMGQPSPRRTMITIPDLVAEISPRSFPPKHDMEQFAQRSRGVFPLSKNSSTSCPRNDAPLSKRKNFLKLDRRRSEPLLSLSASANIGTSSVSLEEPMVSGDSQTPSTTSDSLEAGLQRDSSRKRVKKWATSILGRKVRDGKKATTDDTVEGSDYDDQTPDLESQSVHEEPDLDALFGQDPFTDADDVPTPSFLSPQSAVSDSFFPFFSSTSPVGEDASPVIDLDAALGPYGTPSMSWQDSRPISKRRQLHSSRLARDFVGPGMHYHRRTESAPALAPFEFLDRVTPPGASPMDDVFEEEEDDTAAGVVREPCICDESSQVDEEVGTGIQVVDAADQQLEAAFDWGCEDGLGIERDSSCRMFTPPRTSVVEDVIVEEASPSALVADEDQPRTCLITKSSESSDSRTVSAEDCNVGLSAPQSHNTPMTPTSNAVSTFSSPEFPRSRGSFDALRLGTSASSIADMRTMSSFSTPEPTPEIYLLADDVPSLTSSRSTMISTMYQTSPRREVTERPTLGVLQADNQASEQQGKRSSMHSLSMLLGGPFGQSRISLRTEHRPQTAIPPSMHEESKRKKEHRLSKLMFWRSKSDTRMPFRSK
jgi:hypothetical protein